ncbi:hypothetical protein PAHAL_6G211500 [Panicum hallii]|uniref:Uncharacterized protein n=1 Tax=Panicum hallii TaxID=206008 RepID=A0A2T8IH25_9POAL|nr:hypothetical protein PAHAL_6G211500 [Panicum hallii]
MEEDWRRRREGRMPDPDRIVPSRAEDSGGGRRRPGSPRILPDSMEYSHLLHTFLSPPGFFRLLFVEAHGGP